MRFQNAPYLQILESEIVHIDKNFTPILYE